MSSPDQLAVLKLEERNDLESLLMDFEETWTPERLEDYCKRLSDQASVAFREAAVSELVKIDMHRQWRLGTGPMLETYLERLPILGSAERVSPYLILAEFHARRLQDQELDLESYRARYPNQYQRVTDLAAQSLNSGELGSDSSRPSPAVQASVDTSRVHPKRDTQAERPSAFASQLPTEFGRYRILRELGRGAMGAVFLAHDSQLDRHVAIKTPSFANADHDALVERFYREARASAKLHHRNICPVYDVGEIDGHHFISMALVKGRCLSEYIKPDKLPPQRTSAILVARLALALAEAHRRNIIHRDLKPANIMIDTQREPIVMDFGLARRMDVESRMTETGMAVGTPAYMSPEQIRGEQDEVGPATDIYALGVIFYELLTGQLPFRGQIAQVVYSIVNESPVPPSKIRRDVSPELETICLKMLAKQPGDRYSSMEEVAEAIKSALQENKRKQAKSVEPIAREEATKNSNELESHSETGALNAFFAAQAEQASNQTLVETPSVTPQPASFMSQRATPSSQGGRRRLGGWLAGLAGGFVLIVALGVILLLKTPYGTLRVETVGELEGLEVLVDGETIHLTERQKAQATDHKLQLKLGGTFLEMDPDRHEFVLTKNGEENRIKVSVGTVELASNSFTVAKNGETVLKIELLPEPAMEADPKADIASATTDQAISATNSNTEAAPPSSRESLGDWVVLGFQGWRIENGVLIGEPPVSKSLSDSWLMHRGEFENFEMEFDYQLDSEGNSGVFVRAVQDRSLTKTNKFHEIQLLDDTASRYANVSDNNRNGSLWSKIPPSVRLRLEPGQWHHMKLQVVGNRLRVWSNEHQVVDGQLPSIADTGNRIGLQLHTGKVQFRDIEIRSLESDSISAVPSNPKPIAKPDFANIPQLTIDSQADSTDLTLSPDGRRFAATGSDTPGEVMIWDAQTGDRISRFRASEGPLWGLAYTARGDSLVFSAGRSVRVVSSDDGHLIRQIDFPGSVDITVFPSRNWIVCLNYQHPITKKDQRGGPFPRQLSIWDWESNTKLFEKEIKPVGNQSPRWPSVSPDEKYLTIGMRHLHVRFDISIANDSVSLTNLTSMAETSLVRGPVVFSTDGRLAVTTKKSNTLFAVLDIQAGRILHNLDRANSSDGGMGSRLAFTPDGKHVVVSDMDGGVSLWNAESGILVERLYSHQQEKGKYGPPGLLVTPQGRLITGGGPTDRRLVISQLPELAVE